MGFGILAPEALASPTTHQTFTGIRSDGDGGGIVLMVFAFVVADVNVIPSRAWSEAALRQNGEALAAQHADGSAPKPSLLGLSLRMCNPAHALESVYHVLDVLEGSPAEVSSECTLGTF